MADELSDDQIDDLKEAFAVFDSNKNGMVSTEDLTPLLRSLGQNPKEEETKAFIREIDADGTGFIDFPEFLALVARKQKASIHNEVELYEAFRVFNKSGTGKLGRDDFEEIIKYDNFMSREMRDRMRSKVEAYFTDNEEMDFLSFSNLIRNK